jgi:hypothetical protein
MARSTFGRLLRLVAVVITAMLGLGAVVWTLGGILLLTGSFGTAEDSARVASLSPLSAKELAAAADGERVLLVGQVDPGTPVAEIGNGLAIYVRERCLRDEGGSSFFKWQAESAVLPSFSLVVKDGTVQVSGPQYSLRKPALNEPGKETEGALRYRGFRPGDLVLVDGLAQTGGVNATAVFGGDQAAYVADLKEEAWTRRVGGGCGIGCGLFSGLLFIIILLRWLRSA